MYSEARREAVVILAHTSFRGLGSQPSTTAKFEQQGSLRESYSVSLERLDGCGAGRRSEDAEVKMRRVLNGAALCVFAGWKRHNQAVSGWTRLCQAYDWSARNKGSFSIPDPWSHWEA